MKKLLLLDIDDTICNASEAYDIANKKCLQFLKRKYPVIDEKLYRSVYEIARKGVHMELSGTASMHNRFLYFQRMFEILGLTLDPNLLDEITEMYWKETIKHLKLYPHIKDVLRTLKENNIKIGVVSDLTAHIQIKKLKKLGVSKYIDFIVSSEEAGREKPHPSIFLLALKKANSLPSESVMVGDSLERDIKGAKHLGITAVLFSKNPSSEADFTIRDFREIIEIFGVKEKNFRNKKMIVFDLMGTIFKEPHVIKNILYPLVKDNMSYEDLKKIYVRYSLGEITSQDFWKVVPKDVEKLFLDKIVLEKGILDVFRRLMKKGYLLGILSNIPEPWGNYLLDKFDLRKYFDTIIFSGTYGRRKPDEELYRTFINKARIRPQNCYLIDDKLENLKEARFFLMKTIWKKCEEKEVFFIPDFTINEAHDLVKIFKK